MITFNLVHTEEDYRLINLHEFVNYTHIFDYNIIKSKLTKVDYLKKTPSQSVISYYLFKNLTNFIRESDNDNSVLYIIETLDPNVIENIESIIKSITHKFKKEYEIKIITNGNIVNETLLNNYNILQINA